MLRLFTDALSILRQKSERLLLGIAGVFHSVTVCRECTVREQWNKELRDENRYLKSLLLEPKVQIKERVELGELKPLKTHPGSWKLSKSILEANARKKMKEVSEDEVK